MGLVKDFVAILAVFSCIAIASSEFLYGSFPANFKWGYATGK